MAWRSERRGLRRRDLPRAEASAQLLTAMRLHRACAYPISFQPWALSCELFALPIQGLE